MVRSLGLVRRFLEPQFVDEEGADGLRQEVEQMAYGKPIRQLSSSMQSWVGALKMITVVERAIEAQHKFVSSVFKRAPAAKVGLFHWFRYLVQPPCAPSAHSSTSPPPCARAPLLPPSPSPTWLLWPSPVRPSSSPPLSAAPILVYSGQAWSHLF